MNVKNEVCGDKNIVFAFNPFNPILGAYYIGVYIYVYESL